MKRFLSLFAVLGAFAAAAACDSATPGGTAAAAPTDAAAATADAGTTGGDATAAKADAVADAPGAGDAAVAGTDAAAPATDAPAADVPPAKKPCEGGCKPDEACDMVKNTCKKVTCKLPTLWGTATKDGENQNVQKFSVMKISAKGIGCDLNKDEKPDNAFSGIGGMANGQIDSAMKKGSLLLLIEPLKYLTDGKDFQMNALVGDSVDESNKDCDVTDATKNCKYKLSALSYDLLSAGANCPSKVAFDNAKIAAGKLSAGGDKQTFSLVIEAQGIVIPLNISKVTVKGNTTTDKEWATTTSGQLCGVITEANIQKIADDLPPDLKEQFGPLIKSLIKADIDTDGDGKPDAASISLEFETVKATIVGIAAKK
ncbi:MAG: hypothetical protein EXR79_14005 [Myxococcales bacterium]|nr:hypothetical protein [Myxococcales bacterium]